MSIVSGLLLHWSCLKYLVCLKKTCYIMLLVINIYLLLLQLSLVSVIVVVSNVHKYSVVTLKLTHRNRSSVQDLPFMMDSMEAVFSSIDDLGGSPMT